MMTTWKDVAQWCFTALCITGVVALCLFALKSCDDSSSRARELCIQSGGTWTGQSGICVAGKK